MDAKRELQNVLDGVCDTHPPAIFTQTGTIGMMEHCGCFWPEANMCSESMVKLALQPNIMFGLPTARIPFSMMSDAEALGCQLNPGSRDTQPSVCRNLFCEGPVCPDGLPSSEEFLQKPSIDVNLKAAELLSIHESVYTVAAMNGPFAMVCNAIGMENALMALIADQNMLKQWLNAVEPLSVAYASELADRVDSVLFIDEATTDILPPDYFQFAIGDYLPKAISAARHAYTVLHCCGNTLDVASKLSVLGEDALSPEASACPDYVSRVRNRVKLFGCINPVKDLLYGSPLNVRNAAKKSVEAGFDVIMPECGVPPRSSNENIRALADYRS